MVTEDGAVELNKNVVNGSEPMLRLIGGLPSGTPVAFEAAYRWGWLVDLGSLPVIDEGDGVRDLSLLRVLPTYSNASSTRVGGMRMCRLPVR